MLFVYANSRNNSEWIKQSFIQKQKLLVESIYFPMKKKLQWDN